jgi:hypothetical protein
VGGITYHVAPDVTFDHERARAAARFVDSTAARLGVPPPDRIAYYLTASGEACERLRGIDWIMSASAWTGRAFPDERLICAGNPTLGEAYYHELAHVILAPLSPLERQHRLVGEGAATWLGGGYRGPLASYYQLLREYQRAHPAISFEESLRRFDADNAYYATGALVAQAVVERGGVPALRRLMATGATTDSLLSALPDLLGVQRARLDAWWRREAARRALRSSAAITTPATTP